MINLKVLGSAAVIAMALPMAASAANLPHPGGARGGGAPMAHFSGGAAAFHPGGGAAFHPGGGAAFHPGGNAAFRPGGVGAPAAQYSGMRPGVSGPVAAYSGGRYRGGYGGWHHRDHDRFVPGLVAGALVGGALAADSYAYYGGPVYYGSGYDDQYYDDGGEVAVAPAPVGGDAVTYCAQTYRSYDPASGTYLGYDGLRHPCP